MKYYAETEKAVKLELIAMSLAGSKMVKRLVWVPKSQLDEFGFPKKWITSQKLEDVCPYGAIFEGWFGEDGKGKSSEMLYGTCLL